MKNIMKYTAGICSAALLMTACTSSFEDWNINPNEVTEEQMSQDNLNIGAYFSQMLRGVFIVGSNLGGEYQITEMLTGDIFAQYFANINTYSYTTYHNDQYALYQNWYNAPFNDAYTDIMQPWKTIKDQESETSPALAMATIVKVLGMQRITDMYGPIPYSQFGTGVQVGYDSQQDIYNSFFTELASAIDVLTTYTESNSGAYLGKYDYVFYGNVNKWIKLANTLRLRCAMRVSYADESKAKTEAEAAITHKIGLMSSAEDAAVLHQTSTFNFINPIWEVSESFQDMRMSAMMDSYLNGFEDPRRAVYFRRADNDGQYHGVQNGMSGLAKADYVSACSGMNFESGSDMPWMDAAEAYFLLAEAQLRFGLGEETAQSYYEQGIRTSFTTKGVSGADAYIADDTKLPLTSVTNAVNSRNVDASKTTQLCVKWDEAASTEDNLARIMTQKWIALYPNGQEAWSEMRRTGYPHWINIYSYSYGQSDIAQGELIRRLKFPTTEYSNNTANANAAVSLLGGNDNAATHLWWDAKK